jgi:hypothetical protein
MSARQCGSGHSQWTEQALAAHWAWSVHRRDTDRRPKRLPIFSTGIAIRPAAGTAAARPRAGALPSFFGGLDAENRLLIIEGVSWLQSALGAAIPGSHEIPTGFVRAANVADPGEFGRDLHRPTGQTNSSREPLEVDIVKRLSRTNETTCETVEEFACPSRAASSSPDCRRDLVRTHRSASFSLPYAPSAECRSRSSPW